MLRILSRLRRKPDKTHSVKTIYHVDTAEMDAALAKAEDLEAAIKRARTLAGELARTMKPMSGAVSYEFIVDSEAVRKATCDKFQESLSSYQKNMHSCGQENQ